MAGKRWVEENSVNNTCRWVAAIVNAIHVLIIGEWVTAIHVHVVNAIHVLNIQCTLL